MLLIGAGQALLEPPLLLGLGRRSALGAVVPGCCCRQQQHLLTVLVVPVLLLLLLLLLQAPPAQLAELAEVRRLST